MRHFATCDTKKNASAISEKYLPVVDDKAKLLNITVRAQQKF